LIDEWQTMHPAGKLLLNKTELNDENIMDADQLLGMNACYEIINFSDLLFFKLAYKFLQIFVKELIS
jgi:hypothetical protein